MFDSRKGLCILVFTTDINLSVIGRNPKPNCQFPVLNARFCFRRHTGAYRSQRIVNAGPRASGHGDIPC